MVNETPSNFFKSTRRLRQGDPLSPILFIILVEGLGRLIHDKRSGGEFVGLKPSSSPLIFSHQQFVDDIILGGEASVREARNVKSILNTYSNATGKLINWSKSLVFFINTPTDRQRKIADILGCNIGVLPSTYLGIPLGNKPPDLFWNNLIDRFNKNLEGWKGITLSQTGKVLLIKSTLQNLPTYALSLFFIPSKVADTLESIQRNFMWASTDGNKKYPLVAWEIICRTKKQGGLGIRNLKQFNRALQAKHIRRIFNTTGEWRDILKYKYVANINFRQFISRDLDPRGSNIWNGIMRTKSIAFEKAKWKLGNGENINFQHDEWIRQGPLWNIEPFNR